MLDHFLRVFTRAPDSTEKTLRIAQRVKRNPEAASREDIMSLAMSVIRQAKR